MRKLYIRPSNEDHTEWLEHDEIVTSPTVANVVLFPGGVDVNPAMYGQKKNMRTHINDGTDLQDNNVFTAARDLHKSSFDKSVKRPLLVGVCRGAQFLTVKAGGSLIQHVNNHGFTNHMVRTMDGDFFTAGDHHQMMYPYDVEGAQVIGWCDEPLSDLYYGEDDDIPLTMDESFKEPEIVYYPNIHALCIQFHPEWSEDGAEIIPFLNQLINVYTGEHKEQNVPF